MRFTKAILVSAASLLLPLLGQATPVNTVGTLSVGGLSFDNFACSVTKQGVAGPTSCGKIDVSTISNPAQGIQFSSGFLAGSLGFLSFDDATINYHVTSAAGIDKIGLDFNGTFYGWAISSVTETVKDSNNNIVGFATVQCGPGAIGCTRSDSIALNGVYNDLYVVKDINVSSFVGLAQISYVDQTFSLAPEPGSLAMLGAGLLGVAGLLRRRSKLAAAKAANNNV